MREFVQLLLDITANSLCRNHSLLVLVLICLFYYTKLAVHKLNKFKNFSYICIGNQAHKIQFTDIEIISQFGLFLN